MKVRFISMLITALFALCFPTPSVAGVIESDVLAEIRDVGIHGEIPIIVGFSDKLDITQFKEADKRHRRERMVRALKEKAAASQAQTVGLLKRRGLEKFTSLWAVNALAVKANADLIGELSMLEGVEGIRMDYRITSPIAMAGTPTTTEWNINAIRAPEVWAMGITGGSVVVAGMDTGVDINHATLNVQWRGGFNSWYDPNAEHLTPYDAAGHGTQTMSLMVGGLSNGEAIGVAPSAKWIAVKIFDDAGYAYYSTIHQGFQWLLDPDGNPSTDDAPDVVNNSWGIASINNCIIEFQSDIRTLKTAGIAVVFAAGNYGPGYNTSISPANNQGGFSTGAVDRSLNIAAFSSRGPSACGGAIFPSVSAPGVNVRTANLTSGGANPDSYAYVSGTSFSAPHASGVMALIINGFPGVSVQKIEDSITGSATDAGLGGADNVYGYGILNAAKAYTVLNTDNDGDGYAYAIDCNDADPDVYLSAPEIRHDGIDQDCNGYDLTIDVIKAVYSSKSRTLSVEATSSLNQNAALELAGYGPMKWDARRLKWTMSVKSSANPGSVTVSGPEGSVTAPVTLKR